MRGEWVIQAEELAPGPLEDKEHITNYFDMPSKMKGTIPDPQADKDTKVQLSSNGKVRVGANPEEQQMSGLEYLVEYDKRVRQRATWTRQRCYPIDRYF